jgi:DNA mismatch repair ATPase MutS
MWKNQHKDVVVGWFEAMAEADALIGFARFACNNINEVVYPDVEDEGFCFSAKAMGHPLIKLDVRVNNDVDFYGQPKVMVVTGANMAGKSTFLRMLVVNLIMAMNGAPVCAKSFRFTPCDIMSSINIRDSLSHQASYFYSELVRIREIIDHVKMNPKTLVVLDEILRGTNTKDKQAGSVGLLEKLISMDGIVVVATHDLTIGELERKHPDIVTNHCFEVELENDHLIFDYKLKNGISQKLNASFLMRKMGVID